MRSYVTIILASVALCSCGKPTLVNNTPLIEITPSAIDFGASPVGVAVKSTVQVRNVGQKTLAVEPVLVSETDFTGPTAPVKIGPGESLAVQLTFTPSVEGARSGTFHFLSDAQNNTNVEVKAVGLGTPALTCGTCNTPPADSCASASTALTHAATGTCSAAGVCEYATSTVVCPIACEAATGKCQLPPDGGLPDGGPDTGADAGTDAGVPPDPNILTVPGEFEWTVPAAVSSVTVRAWGGGGAGGVQKAATGGGGAFVQATLAVTPGEILTVNVAQGGLAKCLGPARCNTVGNGAGASLVLRSGTALVIAAGGGGAGSDGNSGASYIGGKGGAGGALIGKAGQSVLNTDNWCPSALGGQGGKQSAGGAGGFATKGSGTNPACNGQPGGPLSGGTATTKTGPFGTEQECEVGFGAVDWKQGGGQGNGRGGGGGSGYFGGGGAGFIYTYCSGGGGGGSSFAVGTAIDVQMLAGTDQEPGNAAESMGAGRGGDDAVTDVTNSSGTAGRVEFVY